MIGAWFSKAVTPLIIAAALFAAGAFLGWLAIATVNGMVDRAVNLKASERDAHWKGEIETANTRAANAEAAQARFAIELERQTSARIAALNVNKEKLENENAALPNGDACGLGRDRVRLLPR
ncbi:hypothetical protein [Agrobacterium pusense]|uniref:Uncharacterized protein n=1 Tax=Agrobacterium pusense TaxID=648995 RepID=A0AA44IZN4_9HYPH|nr:hypothetical protein [Agrobacterium pusense]NRF09360.1 hypothetical protein [Agrobacterium pusense]NRF19735.1 hypothetical protein [Agrobacterium pusense]